MDESDCPSPGSVVVVMQMECFYFGLTNNNGACNLNSRAIACILTFCSGVCGTTDKIFPNSWKMLEFYVLVFAEDNACDGKFIGHVELVEFVAIRCIIWLWQSE